MKLIEERDYKCYTIVGNGFLIFADTVAFKISPKEALILDPTICYGTNEKKYLVRTSQYMKSALKFSRKHFVINTVSRYMKYMACSLALEK